MPANLDTGIIGDLHHWCFSLYMAVLSQLDCGHYVCQQVLE